MPPYTYRVTVAFSWPNWPFIYGQLFGDVAHVYSQTSDSENVGLFGFESAQTPADLGPLVKVELVSN